MKKYYLILLCFLLAVSFLHGQSNGKPDQVKAWRDSLQKFYNRDNNKYLIYADKLKNYYEKQNDTKNLIILKNRISYIYTITGKLDVAVKTIDDAIEMSAQIKNDSLLGLSYITKAAIHFYQKDYLTSIKYFTKGDSLSNNEIVKTNILRNYAFIKKDLGDYLGAIDIYKKLYYSYEHAKGYDRLRLVNLIDIVNSYLDYNDRYKDHPEYYDSIHKYIQIAQNIDIGNTHTKDLVNLTRLRIALGEYPQKGEQLIVKIDSILGHLWQQDIHYVDAPTYFYKARYYYNRKQYQKALHYLQLIDQTVKAGGIKLMYKDQIDALYAKVYKELGMTRKALDKTMELNQLLQAKEQQRILVDKVLRDQYDYKTINRRIRELQERVVKESRTNNYLLFGLLLFFMFLVWTVYRRKVQERNFLKAIDEMSKKLSALDKKKNRSGRPANLPPDKIYNDIIKRLEEFENAYLYLQNNIDLNFMVDYVGYNKSYVSAVINDYYEMNLKDYVNRLRIKYAKEYISNSDVIYNYNIKGMAEEFGFRTAKTFGVAFKKFTGFYPSEYIKMTKKGSFR